MKRAILRNAIVVSAVLLLPGCLAVNAFLGAASLVITGPMQYAGTLYTVGEYTYEYAVNDRTPDEVLGAKLAWLQLTPKTEKSDTSLLTGYAKAMRRTSMDGSKPFVRPEPAPDTVPSATAPETGPVMTASARPSPTPQPAPVTAHTPAPRSTPTVVARQKPAPRPAPAPVVTASTRPVHTYVERDTDPLLVRMHRLERSLAQAERVVLDRPEAGVRHTVSEPAAGQETGISGSWSIRHGLMQLPPAAPVLDATRRAGPHVVVSMASPPPAI